MNVFRIAAAAVFSLASLAAMPAGVGATAVPVGWDGRTLLALTGDAIDGARFAGRVVLLVNTASRCAFTPQYEGLEALHNDFAPAGLTVLGVPSNDFGRQEPGSDADIARFCNTTYGVTFPMLSKSPVVGSDAHELFAWARHAGGRAAVPAWNFHKILIGRDGRFIAGFPSFERPRSPKLVGAIERALARPSF